MFSGTDTFINLSYSEGLPTSVMEVASTGLPIITTDIGGTREIITTDKTGDVGQLAEELRRLYANAELRQNSGKRQNTC